MTSQQNQTRNPQQQGGHQDQNKQQQNQQQNRQGQHGATKPEPDSHQRQQR